MALRRDRIDTQHRHRDRLTYRRRFAVRACHRWQTPHRTPTAGMEARACRRRSPSPRRPARATIARRAMRPTRTEPGLRWRYCITAGASDRRRQRPFERSPARFRGDGEGRRIGPDRPAARALNDAVRRTAATWVGQRQEQGQHQHVLDQHAQAPTRCPHQADELGREGKPKPLLELAPSPIATMAAREWLPPRRRDQAPTAKQHHQRTAREAAR